VQRRQHNAVFPEHDQVTGLLLLKY